MSYTPRHLEAKPHKLWHLVALPVVAALLLVASPASAQSRPSSVTVHKGDTLSGIAVVLCGSASKYPSLAAGNGIKNPNLIFPGQVVKATCNVRPGSSTASRSAPRATPTKAAWVKPGPGGCSDGFSYRSWRPGEFHYGQDIRTGYGARVVSIAAGKVTAAGWSGGAGNRVWVDHGHGVRSIVMHLSYIAVHVGQKVKAGQLLGRSGSTGDSTGPHLHVGITVSGSYVNPKTFMAKRGVKLC